jgi:hypothetical protein
MAMANRALVASGLVYLLAVVGCGSGAASPSTSSAGAAGSGSGGSPIASAGNAGAPASAGAANASGGAGGSSAGGSAPAAGASAGGASAGGAGGAGGAANATGPYFAAPDGMGSACSATQPCSITQAQTTVRGFAASMQSDLVVVLADGTYRLSAPLKFSAADSGMNGHHVIWQAATNAHPILSGAQRIMDWSMHDAAKNIWQATVGTGFDSLQLFVDGALATRARTEIKRSDFTFTATGFTFGAAYAYLNTVVDQKRVEIESIGTFTDRYSPVTSFSNNQATMTQPAWANNNFGYETIPNPTKANPLYLDNAYELLDQPGEWYLNTTTGVLYYIPLAGQDMTQVDVELPKLPLLVSVGGTYDQPVHDIVFNGLQFSHTSWLGPSTAVGYANQQSGTFIAGTGYPAFEAARGDWSQMPGAVQISAAKNITIENGRFVNLGQLDLGIGCDANANASGVGLGVDGITITGNVFAKNSGGGIMVGGVRADAHHPSDPRMIVQNITVNDNLIHDSGLDFRDTVSILVTYTSNAVVSHNEVYNMPYSGISFGFGWGMWDAGGSPDYVNRGTYKYFPIYTTPTTAKNNQLVANLIHDVMQVGGDGGCIYLLSANPGTVIKANHCLNLKSGLGAFYNDEGSRFWTWSNNVAEKSGQWAFANRSGGNLTGDLTLTNNWADNNSTDIMNGQYNNVVTGTVVVAGGAWPPAAQQVITNAGLEAAYKALKP